jgi:Ca-activated chloride channel family protein
VAGSGVASAVANVASTPSTVPAPAPVEGTVRLQALPRFGWVQTGPNGATVDVLVRLTGTGEVPKTRAPVDLAIVLDRSGSMRGEKIVAVKAAALTLLKRLEPTDRVTVISYSDEVTVDAQGAPAGDSGKALRDAVLRVSAGGSTALGPAMITALDGLEKGDRGEQRMAHVMLLSDGMANRGEQDPIILGRRAAMGFGNGVSVSTLGVGIDYNEDLMTRLADQGGGRYHFIKDEGAIAGVLQDEMNGLVATVARGVELNIKGAKVERVFGYPVVREDGRTRVRIGALGAGQVREVVVRLSVPAGAEGPADLGHLTVRYSDVSKGRATPSSADLALTVGRTQDAARSLASEVSEVAVRVSEVEAAEQLEAVARATDKGDFVQADQHLQVAIDGLKQKLSKRPKSKKLAAQLADFEEARTEMKGAQSSSSARKSYGKKFKSKAYRTKKR